ncbi:MAG: NAD-dependent epimerase/dehydratase family protein [Alphaproteobacteria bacterium]|nr:NAD-dependent epimerase/dehydratase family protein [Alphaproteobacteria bacterium]
MTFLVTGAAGFIGSYVVRALAERGAGPIVGIDNLNAYYDPTLKQARLATLEGLDGFRFERIDIADRAAMEDLFARYPAIDRIVHLAAQAGVRYSLENPHAYVEANIVGQLNILEGARRLQAAGGFKHLVYASSSSVYGGNTKVPFSTGDRVDTPVSLYAATKRADELMGHCYGHLYRIPMTGLRFFTVYGPWGRPDMAAYLFTDAMMNGRPIKVFNQGDMSRDFTYIDDIVAGVLAVLDGPPPDGGPEAGVEGAPHRVYNIGNNRPEPLMRLIEVLERALNVKAEIDFQPMQPGDVKATYADISAIARDFGYRPTTPIDAGIPKFVDWYRRYHGL